jgi:hypothetical protein
MISRAGKYQQERIPVNAETRRFVFDAPTAPRLTTGLSNSIFPHLNFTGSKGSSPRVVRIPKTFG